MRDLLECKMLFIRQIITLVGQTQSGVLDLSKSVVFYSKCILRTNIADSRSSRLRSLATCILNYEWPLSF